MLSADAKRYFAKFVKAWNLGRLEPQLYAGVRSAQESASSKTAYKWGFVASGKVTKAELNSLDSIRDNVDTLTNIKFENGGRAPGVDAPKRVLGPSMPPSFSASDGPPAPGTRPASLAELHAARDAQSTSQMLSRAAHNSDRSHKRKDDQERSEELAGGRATGREAGIEKRREANASNREFGDRDGEMSFGQEDLMGGGSTSFAATQARLAQNSTRGRAGRANMAREERSAALSERATAFKSKEDATMDAFRALAKSRFG